MPTPANFPQVITATQGGPSNQSRAEDVLRFSSLIRHVIVADWSALLLRAFISLDAGATWSHVADGPALQPLGGGSPIYDVAAFTCDRANNIIYSVYYSAATAQLSIVPFVATAGGGAFGAAVNSTLGYRAGVNANGQSIGLVVQAQYRAVDTSIWVFFEDGRGASTPPFQNVKAAPFVVGAGWGVATRLGSVNANVLETTLGGIGLNVATGTIHVSIVDYTTSGAPTVNFRHVSISPGGVISAADLVYTTNRPAFLVVQTIGVDASDNLMMAWVNLDPARDNRLAIGPAGGPYSVTLPAFLNGTFPGFAYPLFWLGMWYIFQANYPGNSIFNYYTSIDGGATFSAAVNFGTYLSTDPLDSDLNDFFPVGLSDQIAGVMGIQPGANPAGAAYWGIGVSPAPPGVVIKPPIQKSIIPLPEFHCCSLRALCSGGRMMQIQKGSLI